MKKRWNLRSLTPVQIAVGMTILVLVLIHLAASLIITAWHRQQLRRQLNASILREGELISASTSLFLQDCRNSIRDLLQSSSFQTQLRRAATGALEPPAMRDMLRRFIYAQAIGKTNLFSHVLFVERNGGFLEEDAEGSAPLRLTLNAVNALTRPLYATPAIIAKTNAKGKNPALLVSSACLLDGKYQGQMLAWIKPEALDTVLTKGPAADSLGVFLVLAEPEKGEELVYMPAMTPPHLWQDASRLQNQPLTTPLFLDEHHVRTLPSPLIGIRLPLVNADFSIVLMRSAAVLTEGPARYWFAPAFAAFLAVLLLLALMPFRGILQKKWARFFPAATAMNIPRGLDAFPHIALREVRDAVFVTDAEGNIEYANPAFETITGHRIEDALGQHPRILKSGRHPDGFYREFIAVLKRGERWTGTFVNQRKDGTLYHAKASVTPILDENDAIAHYVAVTSDITTQITAEERLRQAQKMEAVGELVGGVAHDFNNLITVIQGNCNLLLFGLNEITPAARENIDEIMKASERAASLSRRLLAFSRRKEVQPELLELNEVVTNTEKMLQRLIRENIRIAITRTDEPVYIKADLVQIEQLLINLAVNARDAMPTAGKLDIRVGVRHITGDAEVVSLPPGNYAELTVSDTGIGMDEQTRARIFEPFFTTKHDKGGTGLGLATVSGIVKQNNGDIFVESTPGQGAEFTILLPRQKPDSKAKNPAAPPDDLDALQPRSSRLLAPTVLVVDDEDSVLKMLQQSLEAPGYVVYTAVNSDELLDLWQRHRDDIDLLITDVIMPGMSGVEVAKRLHEDRPDLLVLYMSAYTDSMLLELGGEKDDRFFLPKPFSPETLLEKVRDLLESETAENPA